MGGSSPTKPPLGATTARVKALNRRTGKNTGGKGAEGAKHGREATGAVVVRLSIRALIFGHQ